MRKLFSAVLVILTALAVFSAPAADFTGNGRDDIAIFRPSAGLWAVRGFTRAYFGTAGDIPTPGRWTRSDRDQIAIFRPSTGLWAVRAITRNYFGSAGDIPLGFGGGGDSLWRQATPTIVAVDSTAHRVSIGSHVDTGAKLLVAYSSSTLNPQLRLHETSTGYSRLNLSNTATGNFFAIAARPAANSNDALLNFYYHGMGDIMTIRASRRVGIGTTDPANRLDVRTDHAGDYALRLWNTGNNANRYGLRIRCGSNTGAGTNYLIHFNNGNNNEVGKITFSGAVTSYTTTSDERLKENIADADSVSEFIDAILVRQFDWKDSGAHQRYGFVAQELVEVAPEAVVQGATEEDVWSVDNSKLVPMLVKEIQELRERVRQLENRR